MESKVILPFEDQPYSLMFHHTAFPMGIIQANAREDITPWLCGKYINWALNRKDLYHFSIVQDERGFEDGILFVQRQELFPKTYRAIFGDIIEEFKRAISLGNYLYGFYNEEFIPGKVHYQKRHYLHNYLLIGYDDAEQAFVSVGYLEDYRFQRYRIAYEDMRRALETLQSPKIVSELYLLNPDAKFELNLPRVTRELSRYLSSAPTLGGDFDWGLSVYERLTAFFTSLGNDGKPLDIRQTRGIMEHKFFMKMRMEYLLEHGYLCDRAALARAEEIYREAERVHLLALKYNMTGRTSLISAINNSLHQMCAVEQGYLPGVLKALESCKGGERV